MTSYLVDTNVFLYARGKDHPYRDPCRTIVRAARQRRLQLEASVELLMEFTHVLLRRGVPRPDALLEAEDVRAQCRLHDFDAGVLAEAMRLLRGHVALAARDAVHAATAIRAEVPLVLSADRVFDEMTDLRRVDPITLSRALHGDRDDYG